MFLSPTELETLTGYKRPSRQIKWLRERGYIFFVNGKGMPVIARKHADEMKNGKEKTNCRDEENLLERNTIMKRAIPIKPVSGIYFLIAGGVIAYVGKSKNIMVRLGNHLFDKEKMFDAFAYIAVPKGRLSEMERKYIRKFSPHHNRTHTQRRANH